SRDALAVASASSVATRWARTSARSIASARSASVAARDARVAARSFASCSRAAPCWRCRKMAAPMVHTVTPPRSRGRAFMCTFSAFEWPVRSAWMTQNRTKATNSGGWRTPFGVRSLGSALGVPPRRHARRAQSSLFLRRTETRRHTRRHAAWLQLALDRVRALMPRRLRILLHETVGGEMFEDLEAQLGVAAH